MLRPPFDQAGKPLTLSIGSIPFVRAAERTSCRDAGQRYAGSSGDVGVAGFVGAASAQLRPPVQTLVPSARSSGKIVRPPRIGEPSVTHFDGGWGFAAADRAGATRVAASSDKPATPLMSKAQSTDPRTT